MKQLFHFLEHIGKILAIHEKSQPLLQLLLKTFYELENYKL